MSVASRGFDPGGCAYSHVGMPIDGAGRQVEVRRTAGPDVSKQAKLPPGGHADLHKGIMKVQD